MNESIRVLIVDDNALIRIGLSESISLESGLESVGAAAGSEEAVQLYRKYRPDVVTMDYHMPEEDGIVCCSRILSEFPDAKIILLSVFDSEEDIWRAIQVGVKGYLTKTAAEAEDVLEAILEVAEGGTFFPASIMQKLEARKDQPNLTESELKILKLVAHGLLTKEIADRVGISEPMVKFHIRSFREKLEAVDRTTAVVNAYKRGILRLNE